MKKYKIVFVLLTAIYSLLPAILLAQWTQATVNTAWPARYSHTLIANDNKTWEMGGWNGSSLRNDVWNSIGITGPAIPTLVSPPNNSVTNNQTPTFIWNAVPGAVAYDLRLDQRIGDVPMPWPTWEIEPGVAAHATIRYSPDYTYPVTITPWYTTLPYVIPLDSLTWDATETLPWVPRNPIVLFPGDSTRFGMWLTANDSSALMRYTVTRVGDTLTKITTQYDPLSRDSVWVSWAAHNNTGKQATNFELEIECDSLNMHNISKKLPTYGASDAWGCPPTIWIRVITPGPGRTIIIKWEDKRNPIAHCHSKNFGIKIPSNIKIQKAMGRWTKDPPSKGLFNTLHKTLQIADTTWTPTEPIEIGTYDWTVRAQDDSDNWSEFATPWTFTTGTSITYSITGYVRTSAGTGISGVVMSGLPSNPSTDANGYYTGTVDYGWTGTVTPTRTGYSFIPPSTSYSNVTTNQSTNYTGTLQTFTISGYVRTSAGTGISEAVMNGLPGNPNTDANGFYTGTVDYGWSGTVTPTKTDYSFSPPSTSYSNVTTNRSTNYTGTGPTSVEQLSTLLPTAYSVEQNYPNPFNPTTIIRFSLPEQSTVSLMIFDLNGKEVNRVMDAVSLSAGTFETAWHATNAQGCLVTSGVYLARFVAVSENVRKRLFTDIIKLIVLK